MTVAALLAGCAAPAPAPVAAPVQTRPPTWSPVASPPPTCPPSGLLAQVGVVDAAMGLRALGVHLVNCGSRPYRANGYPVVRLLDERHAVLDVEVLQGYAAITGPIPRFDGPPQPVTVQPGRRVTAILVWRNTVTDVNGPTDAAYVDVAPAPGEPAQVLRPPGGIDLGTTGRLGVSPWTDLPDE